MSKREVEIQKEIQDYLVALGAWVVKTVETNKRGTPDIICCLEGRFVAIEVKRPTKGPSPIQQAQIHSIEKANGIAFVAWSVAETQKELGYHFDNL